jgi:restriction system protein
MSKRKYSNVPTYDKLLIPTLKALTKLGGSGTIEEINEKVYQIANLSEDVLKIPHDETGLRSEIDYRLAWSRTYLKKYGLIDNSSKDVWALTKSDIEPDKIDYTKIVKTVKGINKSNSSNEELNGSENTEIVQQIEETLSWKETLLYTLLAINPGAFERLTQRILRESGFVQVEVTGRAGDGGIDGKGIVKISGFLSFHVIFQCKRYKGSVTPSQIRDFRGAMQGRADKGLFITTGTFTRDGAPPIDLIDGELLCEKLKEFKLGVSTEFIEKIEVNSEWFNQF